MKKHIVFLLLLCMLVMNICVVHVYGDGSRIVIGDDSNALIFSGSASDHYLVLSHNGVVTAWGTIRVDSAAQHRQRRPAIQTLYLIPKAKLSRSLPAITSAWLWIRTVSFGDGAQISDISSA